MKCIKSLEENKQHIQRVPDDEAHKKVLTGLWNYISKQEWKNSKKQDNIIVETKIKKEEPKMNKKEKTPAPKPQKQQPKKEKQTKKSKKSKKK